MPEPQIGRAAYGRGGPLPLRRLPQFQLETAAVWCYIVITMKRVQVTIRPIGNSQGIVIPKPLLAQLGLDSHADMSVERGALVLRRPAKVPRAGWAAAAKKVAAVGDDALVMSEFGNEDDKDLVW